LAVTHSEDYTSETGAGDGHEQATDKAGALEKSAGQYETQRESAGESRRRKSGGDGVHPDGERIPASNGDGAGGRKTTDNSVAGGTGQQKSATSLVRQTHAPEAVVILEAARIPQNFTATIRKSNKQKIAIFKIILPQIFRDKLPSDFPSRRDGQTDRTIY
jgi:hypothetical protein